MGATFRFVIVTVAVAAAALLPGDTLAYVLNGATWPQVPVSYYINPANMDALPDAAVITAVRAGADTWEQQSGAAFAFHYAGPSTATATTYDGINLVVFRNAANGSAIATTYTWMTGTQLVDADIVFWDGGFTFFTGGSGCSGGFYIEDIAAHEFGHALGLGHSTTSGATMYPSTSTCNLNPRTLEPDDIAGVRALYPPLNRPPTPTGLRIVM